MFCKLSRRSPCLLSKCREPSGRSSRYCACFLKVSLLKHLTCVILNILQVKICPVNLNDKWKSLVLFYKYSQLPFRYLVGLYFLGPCDWMEHMTTAGQWVVSKRYSGLEHLIADSSPSKALILCHNDQTCSIERPFCNPVFQSEVNTHNGYVPWMKNRPWLF